jgi:hypothetical protein
MGTLVFGEDDLRSGERFYPENVIQCSRYGGGSVIVWGWNQSLRQTNISVNATPNPRSYCEETVMSDVASFLNQGQSYSNQIMFDRTPQGIHKTFYNRKKYQCIGMTHTNSPDSSPIEHVWDSLGQYVKERHNVNNLADLNGMHQQD